MIGDIKLQAGKLAQYNQESKSKYLCPERMKIQQFSREIRDYLRFKSDFQRQVESSVGGE